MTLPVRLQLSRRAGFNLQAASRALNGLEAVSVARPTRWGNPFAGDDRYHPSWRAAAVDAFRLENHRRPASEFAELRGKNLACWCRPEETCHADVLLELANREEK